MVNSNNFTYIKSDLHAEEVSLTEIANNVGTPFYCYSSSAIAENFIDYETAFFKLDTLICYAVKANSNQAVLKTLAKMGAGADVVSEGEIRRALLAGIPAQKVVFSGVAKTASEIQFALEKNILQFNVESEPELKFISEVATRIGKTAAISIRVNPNVCANTHAKITTGMSENKFGIPISKAVDIYKTASDLPGIKVQGVDVHIGSQLTELAPFKEAYKKVAQLVSELKSHDHDISVIDIGGGLGIDYDQNTDLPTKDEYAQVACDELSHLNCKIIVEPGRSIVGNAGVLISKVVYVKEGEERKFLILDAGMNDLIRPSMYDAYHNILPVSKHSNQECMYDVVGPVCETGDTFSKNRSLPEMQAGDLVAIMSCGAYGAVMSSSYNTRMLAPEVMVKNLQFSVIRKRVDYHDFIKADSIPDWLD